MSPSPPESAPAVSVLLVVFNAGVFLRPAVDSILGQTCRDLELVVIDNASDDGSVAALPAGSDARLRIVRLETNRGQAGGWRAGAPLCRGELIALMDADDIAHPDRIATQRAFLHAQPEFGVVATCARTIDAHGREGELAFSLVQESEIRRYAELGMPVLFPTAMLRRTLVEKIGFHAGGSWAADYEFLLRALEITRVSCLERVLYFYRRHDRSMTRTGRAKQSASAAFARLRAARRRRGLGEDPALSEAAEARWLAHPADLRAMHREFGRRALAAGEPALALLHARRLRSFVLVLRALGQAHRDPRGPRFLIRLALWGPVHALRVGSTVHPRFGWKQALTLGRAGAPGTEPL